MEPITLYITLLLAGSLLIGLEIFLPGGILGVIGAMIWVAAGIVSLIQFTPPWNVFGAMALLATSILTFIIWIRYFPKSPMGKMLSLNNTAKEHKAHIQTEIFPVGTVGITISILRPAGIASFEGRRLDVMADGEWIEAGQPVKISSTKGGYISVVKA